LLLVILWCCSRAFTICTAAPLIQPYTKCGPPCVAMGAYISRCCGCEDATKGEQQFVAPPSNAAYQPPAANGGVYFQPPASQIEAAEEPEHASYPPMPSPDVSPSLAPPEGPAVESSSMASDKESYGVSASQSGRGPAKSKSELKAETLDFVNQLEEDGLPVAVLLHGGQQIECSLKLRYDEGVFIIGTEEKAREVPLNALRGLLHTKEHLAKVEIKSEIEADRTCAFYLKEGACIPLLFPSAQLKRTFVELAECMTGKRAKRAAIKTDKD